MGIGQLTRAEHALGDRHLYLLSTGVAVAALVPIDAGAAAEPVRIGLAAAAVVTWWLRKPAGLILLVVVYTSVAAGAQWAESGPLDIAGQQQVDVRLASDPEPVPGGVRVRGEVDGDTIDLRAWGGAAGWLRGRLMGEVVRADVSVRPLNDPPSWVVASGLDGRGTIHTVHGWTEGRIHTRVANSLRRTIESGARSLTRDERSLYTGLVYGDDRYQSPLMLDDFDAAGLSHLVAVSGQNVAFALAIAGPALRRMGHRQRWVAIAALLVVFATMTRFEPSVMRAAVMAAIAATGSLIGTAVPSTRVLLLAGVGLLVWRPLLIHSVAFQLSVAASAGILAWSARLARAVPGPRVAAEAIAVTASAQLAVAPLLLWRFGGVPVAALPANLAAGPASGPVMMWGMTAGWVAGLVPEPISVLIHWPTRVGLAWIAGVARWSAGLALGELQWPHVLALGPLGWLALGQVDLARRRALVLMLVVVLALPAATSQIRPAPQGELASGTILLRSPRPGTQTVVIPTGDARQVLADLRRAQTGAIDLLIIDKSSYANATLLGWLQTRHTVDTIWAPEPTLGYGEIVPGDSDYWTFGDTRIAATIEAGRLTVFQAPDEP